MKKIEIQKKQVSAIIPNYNGKSLLAQYLPHVLATLKTGDELIIVDDFSTDSSVKYLVQQYKLQLVKKNILPTQVTSDYFPQENNIEFKLYTNTVASNKQKITMQLVALQLNVRFAAAANTGILFAHHDYILLLNSDVKPTKNVRNQLLQHFSDTTVFGVGCLEYERDHSGEKSGKNRLWFSRGLFMHSKAKDMLTGPTAWVSGGSGMFDKHKWVALGGFDQLFFPAYWEDVDLSFRARKKGWKVLFDQDAVVYHIHESTNTDVYGSQKIINMSWDNAIKFVKKNANFWQLLQHYLFLPYWKYVRSKLVKQEL